MLKNNSIHLSKNKQIELGSFYTPKILVDKVSEFIECYKQQGNKKNIIVFDNASGCGAFIDSVGGLDYRFSDCDKKAYDFLCSNNLDKNKIFCNNSLHNVSRKKYDIPNKAFLIQVGNPPYNDTTSEFKNGQKGKNKCDPDLFDRDLGISFLKSFNKLKADVVCVLHPLSYLIKKTNFNRLKEFKENYTLKKGFLFPSSMFNGTGSIKFPIMIGLYERNEKGMNFEYIENFSFSIINSDTIFKLNTFETIDGYIHKYPPVKNGPLSSIGLYYYTVRDFNSLRKNTSFLNRVISNGIVVEIENFYKYAYLYTLKNLFMPSDIWLYGNLSPLVSKKTLEKHKNKFVTYALLTNPIVKNLDNKILTNIIKYYDLNINKHYNQEKEEMEIIKLFKELLIK